MHLSWFLFHTLYTIWSVSVKTEMIYTSSEVALKSEVRPRAVDGTTIPILITQNVSAITRLSTHFVNTNVFSFTLPLPWLAQSHTQVVGPIIMNDNWVFRDYQGK